MHLAYLAPVGGSQIPRGVLLPLRTVASRIAAHPPASTEAASDERPLLVEQALDLLLVALGGLAEALAEAARAFGHEQGYL
jgi:hypothetical protein